MSETTKPTPEEIRLQTAEVIINKTSKDYPVAKEVFNDDLALNAFSDGFVKDCLRRIVGQLKLQPDINNQGIPNKDAEFLMSLKGLVISKAELRLDAARAEYSIQSLFGKGAKVSE